jgi:hypothetical protein
VIHKCLETFSPAHNLVYTHRVLLAPYHKS